MSAWLSDRPPLLPFGYSLSASLAVRYLRDVQPFTLVHPSGSSLDRSHLEAGRLSRSSNSTPLTIPMCD